MFASSPGTGDRVALTPPPARYGRLSIKLLVKFSSVNLSVGIAA